jgi:hypothetical protein
MSTVKTPLELATEAMKDYKQKQEADKLAAAIAQIKAEADKRIREMEANLLKPEKLLIAQKIALWINDFIKTELYSDLVKTKPLKLFGYGSGLQLYCNGWGHGDKHITNDRGCNSIIYFNNNQLTYIATYKWMGQHTKCVLTDPDTMANCLHIDYLTAFWRYLESGTVYKYIQNNLLPT